MTKATLRKWRRQYPSDWHKFDGCWAPAKAFFGESEILRHEMRIAKQSNVRRARRVRELERRRERKVTP